MRGSCVEPCGGIGIGDATADLHPAGPCLERGLGGGFITSAQLDDMSAAQIVGPILFGKPHSGLIGLEISHESLAVIVQRAADDLFDPALVEVDAGAKLRHRNEFDARIFNLPQADFCFPFQEVSDISGQL